MPEETPTNSDVWFDLESWKKMGKTNMGNLESALYLPTCHFILSNILILYQGGILIRQPAYGIRHTA